MQAISVGCKRCLVAHPCTDPPRTSVLCAAPICVWSAEWSLRHAGRCRPPAKLPLVCPAFCGVGSAVSGHAPSAQATVKSVGARHACLELAHQRSLFLTRLQYCCAFAQFFATCKLAPCAMPLPPSLPLLPFSAPNCFCPPCSLLISFLLPIAVSLPPAALSARCLLNLVGCCCRLEVQFCSNVQQQEGGTHRSKCG